MENEPNRVGDVTKSVAHSLLLFMLLDESDAKVAEGELCSDFKESRAAMLDYCRDRSDFEITGAKTGTREEEGFCEQTVGEVR